MPVKRTAPQADHRVHTNEQMVYRLQTKSPSTLAKTSHDTPNILGVPTHKLYQDLLKTALTTIFIVAILLVIKWSQVLS